MPLPQEFPIDQFLDAVETELIAHSLVGDKRLFFLSELVRTRLLEAAGNTVYFHSTGMYVNIALVKTMIQKARAYQARSIV